MVPRAADNTRPDSLASQLRRRRLQLFLRMLEGIEAPRILDLGGGPRLWLEMATELPPGTRLTFINLETLDVSPMPNAVAVIGDVRSMPQFPDGSFDVAFSNSVIEHVGTFHDQMAMAREVRRVARGYFVQTPNKWFPIEAHYLVPGWQFLPLAWRARLLCWADIGWAKRYADPMLARADVEQIRLLNAAELRYLFPGAELRREKIGPLTKSLIVVRPPDRTRSSSLPPP